MPEKPDNLVSRFHVIESSASFVLVLQVFSSLRDIIARGTPLAVCLAAAHFLGHCGSLKVPSNLQVHCSRSHHAAYNVM